MPTYPLEPFLTAKDLRLQLMPYAPGVCGEINFPKLLPLLPYALYPGGKRKVYKLSAVLAALDRLVTLVEPHQPEAGESPLHRRRPRLSKTG